MKLYFDTCCYNRPYDNQAQKKIRDESLAISRIIKTRHIYGHIVYSSLALDEEIGMIINADKKRNVLRLYTQTATMRADYVENVFNYVVPLAKQAGIKGYDVFHLCYSVVVAADYLLTVDDPFLKAASGLSLPVKVINPLQFLGGVI